MDTVKIEKGTCRMIAHRGVSGLEKENTCAAFVAAGVKSYYGIETDVHVTADGKYFIFHDDHMGNIAGVDLEIEKSTAEQLRAVRMCDADGRRRSDLVVPELEDYISICRKYEKEAVLELKNRMEEKHIASIAAIIKDMGWLEHTTFISFAAENLVAIRKLYKDVSIQFLTGEASEKNVEFMKTYHIGADFRGPCVGREVVEKLHAEGLPVNCWTIDAPEDAQKLISMGVDFITTNILE